MSRRISDEMRDHVIAQLAGNCDSGFDIDMCIDDIEEIMLDAGYQYCTACGYWLECCEFVDDCGNVLDCCEDCI